MVMWLEDFEYLADPGDDGSSKLTIDIIAISPDDYKKFFTKIRKEPISEEQLRKRVLKAYYKWLKVWNLVEANRLPSIRKVDYVINLIPGSLLIVRRVYGMSRE